MPSPESKARLDAFDRMQRERIAELTAAGETHERALERVKYETRPEYFRILHECGDISVYPVSFPSNDYRPPAA